jgi:transposase
MERLETKRIHGHTYYYYSHWEWRDGRCRRAWQKYLGKLEDIVRAVEDGGPCPRYAEVFQWGLSEALWQECGRANICGVINRHVHKRGQGLATGEYLAIAALNRAMQVRSKRSLWHWFAATTLLRRLPKATAANLSSQRFWDHMDRISVASVQNIWREILQGVVARESIDLSHVCYDGTNFYTFIDTFNTRCHIARRGKNKQGRSNLRQVSYALFCCADGQLPLYYEIYDGNRNDAKQFPLMLERFRGFFRQLAGAAAQPDITVIFDKGNNSKENFQLLDGMQQNLPLSYVGSVKLDEHKELAVVPNDDARFQTSAAHPPGCKSFRIKKNVYGRQRLLVVTYNQNLFDSQRATVQADIGKALERLGQVQTRLEDRRAGLITGGRAPTQASVHKQCQAILKRQHLKRLITITLTADDNGLPRLQYALDSAAQQELENTYLGKNILISDREAWDDARIIDAYRSQFLIEGVFKEVKDRSTGNWWPMFHWTDSKIQVHALYCTIAVLLRALLWRRVRQAGLQISLKRLLGELQDIREIVNIYPARGKQKEARRQTVLSKRNELQERLLLLLGLPEGAKKAVLG